MIKPKKDRQTLLWVIMTAILIITSMWAIAGYIEVTGGIITVPNIVYGLVTLCLFGICAFLYVKFVMSLVKNG